MAARAWKCAVFALVFWLIPNGEGAWVQDAAYDACRTVSGHDDWRCE